MDTDELAALITGRQYPFEMTEEEVDMAHHAGLVVAFGDSDDRLGFLGAINDELGAWNGTTALLDADGLLQNECDDERCPYFEKLKEGAVELTSIWCALDQPPWTIKTDIPHATFDIMEDGKCQSRGIVFSMTDLAITYNK